MVRGVLRREKGFRVLGIAEDFELSDEDGEFEDLIFNEGQGREDGVVKEIEGMGVE